MAGTDPDDAAREIRIARSTETRGTSTLLERNSGSEPARNDGLIQSIVRAHVWVRNLQDGTYDSIEALAEANLLHPKVVRQALRLAFLSPEVASAVLEGSQPERLSLARVPKLLPLAWTEHRRLLA
jgi:site-specific DNA recombinase